MTSLCFTWGQHGHLLSPHQYVLLNCNQCGRWGLLVYILGQNVLPMVGALRNTALKPLDRTWAFIGFCPLNGEQGPVALCLLRRAEEEMLLQHLFWLDCMSFCEKSSVRRHYLYKQWFFFLDIPLCRLMYQLPSGMGERGGGMLWKAESWRLSRRLSRAYGLSGHLALQQPAPQVCTILTCDMLGIHLLRITS